MPTEPQPHSESPVVVAVIPVRGNSKGVPRKNVAKVGGIPLVARAIRAAQLSGAIDTIYVSTDDKEIGDVARDWGARVIARPEVLATDTSTSEEALLHALNVLESSQINPDVLVFIQATSPFIDPEALNVAVNRVATDSCDVVFSAFETFGFLWREDSELGAVGVNHDAAYRPRRQDREPHFQESGAFYVMNARGFKSSEHRFFGRVAIQEVPVGTAIEIDTAEELRVARTLATLFPPSGPTGPIHALVMDFDGVHTDDLVHVDQDGHESVVTSRSDGMGVSMLRELGIKMLILSKERNPVVSARARKLDIPALHPVDDKREALVSWCKAEGIDLRHVCYVGNDVNDIECLSMVGWAVVVADAHPQARAHAHTILLHSGGRGAIRELTDMVLATLDGVS